MLRCRYKRRTTILGSINSQLVLIVIRSGSVIIIFSLFHRRIHDELQLYPDGHHGHPDDGHGRDACRWLGSSDSREEGLGELWHLVRPGLDPAHLRPWPRTANGLLHGHRMTITFFGFLMIVSRSTYSFLFTTTNLNYSSLSLFLSTVGFLMILLNFNFFLD